MLACCRNSLRTILSIKSRTDTQTHAHTTLPLISHLLHCKTFIQLLYIHEKNKFNEILLKDFLTGFKSRSVHLIYFAMNVKFISCQFWTVWVWVQIKSLNVTSLHYLHLWMSPHCITSYISIAFISVRLQSPINSNPQGLLYDSCRQHWI